MDEVENVPKKVATPPMKPPTTSTKFQQNVLHTIIRRLEETEKDLQDNLTSISNGSLCYLKVGGLQTFGNDIANIAAKCTQRDGSPETGHSLEGFLFLPATTAKISITLRFLILLPWLHAPCYDI